MIGKYTRIHHPQPLNPLDSQITIQHIPHGARSDGMIGSHNVPLHMCVSGRLVGEID